MTVTISRLYDTYDAARQAVCDLEAAGVASENISLVASNADRWYDERKTTTKTVRKDRDMDGTDDRVEGAEAGAGIGAVLGGTAGLLAGLGIMAIPGIGPVVAAGWLAATAAGAAAGGATGGIIGALTQAGTSEDEAHVYAEGIRRGGTLLSVRVREKDRARYEAIMDRAAVNITDRAVAYRESGWSEFDSTAKPYTAEEVRREREMYR